MAAVLLHICSVFVVWVVLWPISEAALICPTSCTCLGGLIDCSKKGLVTVPTDLQHCSWGTRLELQSNGITSLGPTDFKGLEKLEVLFLNHNDITYINGSIFEDLTSLHTLKITHNKLTEMPVFPEHLVIKELSLAYNMIHTISAEALQALPHLVTLSLDHNQIMDIPVGAFPTPSYLTHLYLNHNKIMRLEPGCLDNLTSLEQLKLNKNHMFELGKDIFSTLANLRFLELSRNKIGMIQGLTFKGLSRLQVLKLKRNSIATLMDGAFWGLENINNLQLDYNSIKNVTSSWLFGLSSLKQLSLTHNRIGAIQEDGWDCCKDNLNKLDLAHNQLQTIYTKTFRKLANLESLLLDHNRLSRIDDGAFSGLSYLITLELNDNAIAWTMEDMTGAFRGLESLMKLGLKMNHIKSITNHAFTGLAALQQLHLEDNEITTIQRDTFTPLANLRELRLNSTNLLCDCQLGWLASWLKSYGFQSEVIAVCSYPDSLRGKSIFDIPPSLFVCNDQEMSKPVIVSSPESQNTYKGENLTLTCQAQVRGDVQATVQWKKDYVVLPDSLHETYGESDGEVKRYTSSLRLYNVQDNMAGRYQCVVTNKFGSNFSDKAIVNVYVFPVFIKKPVDITVKAGQSAKLQCSASGQPQPVISWHKDGGDDFPAARERRMYVIPKDDQFFIASTKNLDQGIYTCRASNEAGVITANATVTILETPDFISPMEEEKRAGVGGTAVLECMASGSPRPKLTWLKDGRPLVVTPRHFFTAHSQLLIIVETKWDDAGVYTCQMSNTLGIMRGATTLKIVPSEAQAKSSRSTGGLDDESTTTGIIIIAVVCCVVGTSLVWVIIIYRTRKRHEMYTATPTDETMLPGDMASNDKDSGYTHTAFSGMAYHYQDYQLKESGYESSSGQYHTNTWLTTPAAIFPSDVEEDEGHDPSQRDLRPPPATSTSGEDSDSVSGCPSTQAVPDSEEEGSSHNPGLMRVNSTLSTFHPGPTNHDRSLSRSIALPAVCGETEMGRGTGSTNHDRCVSRSVTLCGQTETGSTNHDRFVSRSVNLCGETETETRSTNHDRFVSRCGETKTDSNLSPSQTMTPCSHCGERERVGERCGMGERCGVGEGCRRTEGCVRQTDSGSSSDSSSYHRPHPPRASSVSSLPPGTRVARPVAGCCCHRGMSRIRQPLACYDTCTAECVQCEGTSTVCSSCTHPYCHLATEC